MTLRTVQKVVLWAFWAANLITVITFWAFNSGQLWGQGLISPELALGRLAGLLATFAALTQFVLMGREGWLEPVFGLDRITHFHRRNGYTAISFMLLHPTLILLGYAGSAGIDLTQQILLLLGMPYVLWALIALCLFIVIVGFSIYIVRKRLPFEVWYYVHLLTYVAIVLLPFHQLTNGGDLATDRAFATYWICLYLFAGLNLLVWRFGRPFYLSFIHQFEIARVVIEAPRATSVYIAGKHLDRFKPRGGQFILVRFLTKELWWQEHPFSLSMLPDKGQIRLTIRQLGDFTNQVPNLKPGTKVAISGPHGAFVADRATHEKLLLIAGGIGITPLRSLLQEFAAQQSKRDIVLLYGNRNRQEIVLQKELEQFATQLSLRIHHVLSDDPAWKGEKGFIDQEKIARLVPDIAKRDVFLCGPPPMMRGVRQALSNLRVPALQLHYERFALHPKD
jgi:predicted ferric reductase